jgi:hypothetical protein
MTPLQVLQRQAREVKRKMDISDSLREEQDDGTKLLHMVCNAKMVEIQRATQGIQQRTDQCTVNCEGYNTQCPHYKPYISDEGV